MRKKGNKSKKGKSIKCPKCNYSWKTKQNKPYICCSACKRYFKVKKRKYRKT